MKIQPNRKLVEKRMQYKALGLLFIVGLILIITILPFVSALEVDNVKNYDAETNTVTITNNFGLGSDIGTIKLVNYSRYCFADNCYAYYELTQKSSELAYKGSSYALVKDNRVSQAIEVWDATASYEVPKYKQVCAIVNNKTSNKDENQCNWIDDGKETKYGKWVTYDYSKAPIEGKQLIREKVNVNAGETVDLIPNFYGKDITEWALFTGMTRYERYFPPTGDDACQAQIGCIQTFTIGTTGTNTAHELKGVQVTMCFDNTETIYASIYPANNLTSCNLTTTLGYGELTIAGGGYCASYDAYNITMTQNASLSASSIYCLKINTTNTDTGAQNLMQANKTKLPYSGGRSYQIETSHWYNNTLLFEEWGTEVFANTMSMNTYLISPPDDYLIPTTSQIFQSNFSVAVGSGNLTNATLYVWKEDGTLLGTNFTTRTGITNVTNLSMGGLDYGYKWNYLGCAANSTKTICQFADNNRTLKPIMLGLCNSTLNVSYVNFSIIDEGNSSGVAGRINSLTWYYWLSSPSFNKTFTYSTVGYNISYAFCFSPSDRNISNALDMTYSAVGYPQKSYSYSGTYNNITTNTSLTLLSTADGIYVTFQVLNLASQTLSGVSTTAETEIGGVWTNVSSGTTDAAGSITFFLNPNNPHRFTFIKSGYDTLITTITPTQTLYTVTMGSSSTTTIPNYETGITTYIGPAGNTLLSNRTYQFNFTVITTNWTLDKFGFSLTNGNNILYTTSSTIGTGGTVLVNMNTTNNQTVLMKYYWVINGTYKNYTRMWSIGELSGTEWSIKNFFTDLKTYTTGDNPIFGLNNFSLTLIIFVIIFVIVGFLTYSTGLYSPLAISIEVAVLVTFFNWVGVLPNPIGANAPDFHVMITWLLVIVFIIKEYTQ